MNKKIAKHIQIVCSPSSIAARTKDSESEMIFSVLKDHYQQVELKEIHDIEDLRGIASTDPDLVFLGGGPKRLLWGEEWQASNETLLLSSFAEDAGLTYTGSQPPAMQLDMVKAHAKDQVRESGQKTAQFFTAFDGEYSENDQLPLPFPLFVKPADLGSGRGIDTDSVVRSFDELEGKIESISAEYDTEVLVEEYLTGREFTVAILAQPETAQLMAMPIELIAQKDSKGQRIVSGSVKQSDTEKVVAIVDDELRSRVSDTAIRIFQSLGARDYGRVDLRMNAYGELHFLEANLRPGLGGGYFARACRINAQLSYSQVILSIAELGLARNTQTSGYLEDLQQGRSSVNIGRIQ